MGKLARKQGQAYRREARAILAKNQQAFDTKIEEKLKIFNEIVKPKPRFIPSWAWRSFSKIFLDVPKLQEFLGVNKQQQAPAHISSEAMDLKIGVEIFKTVYGKLPTEEHDELTVEDFNVFIGRFAGNRRYKTLVEHARRLRDKEKERLELSTEKAS